jgi:DNA-binding response OmpR family regulator
MVQNADTILIVEDSPTTRELLCAQIELAGYTVWQAEDLDQARHILKDKTPNLILLDIVLPKESGVDLLESLRKVYPFHVLPIIMITAKDEALDIIKCFNLGANDYITKPFYNDVVMARIKAQLNIVLLQKENLKKKELETVQAMVTTYSHEINNPLVSAITSIKMLKEEISDPKLEKAEEALYKVAKIVKRISELTENTVLEYENYSQQSKKIKLNSP